MAKMVDKVEAQRKQIAELEAERDDIGNWLDEWMKHLGHDFPKRDGNRLMGRVNILAQICHANIGYHKTATRIGLEQQERADKAEKRIAELVEEVRGNLMARREVLEALACEGSTEPLVDIVKRVLASANKKQQEVLDANERIEAFRLGWKPKDGTEAGRDSRWRFEFDRMSAERSKQSAKLVEMRKARDALTVEAGRLQVDNTAMRGVLRKSVRGCDPATDYARCSEGGQGICPTEAACELLAQKHSANPSGA